MTSLADNEETEFFSLGLSCPLVPLVVQGFQMRVGQADAWEAEAAGQILVFTAEPIPEPRT